MHSGIQKCVTTRAFSPKRVTPVIAGSTPMCTRTSLAPPAPHPACRTRLSCRLCSRCSAYPPCGGGGGI